MEIKIFWDKDGQDTQLLLSRINDALETLWLTGFIAVELSDDTDMKQEFNITQFPALILMEPEIDFKDMIFEGMVPDEEEIKWMFMSIVWGGDTSKCAPGGCGSGGCSC